MFVYPSSVVRFASDTGFLSHKKPRTVWSLPSKSAAGIWIFNHRLTLIDTDHLEHYEEVDIDSAFFILSGYNDSL